MVDVSGLPVSLIGKLYRMDAATDLHADENGLAVEGLEDDAAAVIGEMSAGH